MKLKLSLFQRPEVLLFLSFFSLLLCITMLLTTSGVSKPTIRSDGKGYYLYLPSVFIYHDLTMQWTQPLRQTDHPDPTGREWYGTTLYSQGKYFDKYTIGQSILWAPFFLAAHVLTLVSGHPATGFTALYQASIGLAAAFYAALGCVLMYLMLQRYFSRKVAYFVVLTILLGTNMLSYATYDSSFTHVYSLCLIAAILYLLPKWYSNMTYRTSILLAILFALNVLVRQTNIILFLVIVLWGISSRVKLQQRIELLWRQRLKLVAMLGIGLLVISPQLLYWKYITGHWLIFSYRDEGFNFLHPQMLNVLFSAQRGVFFWAPVLLLALLGFVLLYRYLRDWAIPIYVFLPIWLWVISSWHSWSFGLAYGHRAFIDLFPLFALAIALVYSRTTHLIVYWLLSTFVGVCLIANLFLTYQYWVGGLPGADMSLPADQQVWSRGFAELMHSGLAFGFLGLVGLVVIALGPLTHYMLLRPATTEPGSISCSSKSE